MKELKEGLERSMYNKKRKLLKSSSAASTPNASASQVFHSGAGTTRANMSHHHRVPPIQMKFHDIQQVNIQIYLINLF